MEKYMTPSRFRVLIWINFLLYIAYFIFGIFFDESEPTGAFNASSSFLLPLAIGLLVLCLYCNFALYRFWHHGRIIFTALTFLCLIPIWSTYSAADAAMLAWDSYFMNILSFLNGVLFVLIWTAPIRYEFEKN
ncbi:MAG: hypothetical protein V4691_01525 [Pseudomonadota bacterium]